LEAAGAKLEASANLQTETIQWRLRQPVSGPEFSRRLKLYLGPRDRDILSREEHKLTRVLDQVFLSSLTRPLVGPMTRFLKGFHDYAVPNYGIAIIMLTLLIKALFFPLTKKSMMSMKAMRKIQPEMQALREKYQGDAARLNQEVMKLYRESGVNPLGGCLPVLIQLPIFIALYTALAVSIDLRHAPFFLWIDDLSHPEALWAVFGIPVRLLPLLMGVSMVVSQKMTPMAGMDPLQQKMLNWMPILFTVISWGFPSGLVLYWLVNNLLQIVQQQIINRTANGAVGAKVRKEREAT
jgi:YidC/Oxa1 family membrane protein insertase